MEASDKLTLDNKDADQTMNISGQQSKGTLPTGCKHNPMERWLAFKKESYKLGKKACSPLLKMEHPGTQNYKAAKVEIIRNNNRQRGL